MELKLVTMNVDFALRAKRVQQDLEYAIKNADVITFQEAKRVDIDRLIKDPDWEVFQPMRNDATKGSGIAWKKSVAKRVKRGKLVGVTPHGRAMLTRYIVWVNLKIDGQVIRVVSLHMPPKRFWTLLYGLMLKNLSGLINRTRVPMVIGADWNKLVNRAPDLHVLAKSNGGWFVGVGIDGFLIIHKGKIKLKKVRKLRDTNSDHDPVQIVVEVLTAASK